MRTALTGEFQCTLWKMVTVSMAPRLPQTRAAAPGSFAQSHRSDLLQRTPASGTRARIDYQAVPPLDVARLESLGFFRHLGREDAQRAAALAREKNYAFAEDVRRLYRADAENLAEHGVRDFIGEVAPFLRHEGVPIDVSYREVKVPARAGQPAGRGIPRLDANGWLDREGPYVMVESMRLVLRPGVEACHVTEDDFGESATYILFLGEREYVLYSFGPGEEWDGWQRVTCATLALLDELLAAHGLPERAYATYYGHNDQQVAFATPEMARIINESTPAPDRHGRSTRLIDSSFSRQTS